MAAAPEPLCWIGGRIVPEREATIPVRDRAFRYGAGLFETVRVANGRPFRLDAHLGRMRAGAEALGIEPPRDADPAGVASALCEAWSPSAAAVLKLFLTAGDPPDLAPALVARIGAPWPLPEGARERGVAVEVAADFAAAPGPISGLKTLARLERDLAWRAARARGSFDALLLDRDGRVVEGCATNLFFARGGRLATPDTALGALPGIARGIAIRLARELGFAVETGAFPLAALEAADEAFLTNALVGVLAIRSTAGRSLGGAPGPITRALAAAYDALVERECPR